MQASLVALAAALMGIVLERAGTGLPYVSIIGTAFIMGAFIVALTSFLLFLKNRLFTPHVDELTWSSESR